jgi:hypothetical protein
MTRPASVFHWLAGLGIAVIVPLAIPSAAQLGSVDNGRYRHFSSGVAFPLPSGWAVDTTGPSSDGGDQVYLRDATSPEIYVAIWMKKETNTKAEVRARLELAAKMKVDQRGGAESGYRFRPESIRHETIRGHQAISAIADYPSAGRFARQVEYFTWIFTERTRVQFDVRGPEPDAAAETARLNQIILAASIP